MHRKNAHNKALGMLQTDITKAKECLPHFLFSICYEQSFITTTVKGGDFYNEQQLPVSIAEICATIKL